MFLIGKRSPFLGEMKNSVVTIRAATARLRVDRCCVRVLSWCALLTNQPRTKPRNHTNQESRKDMKVRLISQVQYYPNTS